MRFVLETACGCAAGKIRKNNEDNFLFHDRCLPLGNKGMKKAVEGYREEGFPLCLGVFDGMGGESRGEEASYAAARTLREQSLRLREFVIPERTFLKQSCDLMNDAVLRRRKELEAERMGTTAAIALFHSDEVYVCNIGDSRAYRLRRGVFQQLTRDDWVWVRDENGCLTRRGKAITQYLGADPQELKLSPHIAKGALQHEDRYLLCSDGLTDMLTTFEIADIMLTYATARDCVNALIRAALANGGRDNVTAIVCRVLRKD